MVRRANRLGRPADHVEGPFPDAPVRPGAPAAAAYVRAVALALRSALAGHGLAATCRAAGLARSTVQDLLAGRSWPDLVTLAALEGVLDTRLWPDRDALG